MNDRRDGTAHQMEVHMDNEQRVKDGFGQIYREVHALCMRHLDADAVALALLGNAVRGLMERYGIAEARKYAEGFLHDYLDRAACDPDYEHLLGVPQHAAKVQASAVANNE